MINKIGGSYYESYKSINKNNLQQKKNSLIYQPNPKFKTEFNTENNQANAGKVGTILFGSNQSAN